MPYDVVKRGGKFVVQKADGSKTFGTHDTKEEADAQLAALNIAERRMAESRSLHLLGALGQVRTEMIGHREHLVVPVVALMEGVIHAVNAETPEFVSVETLKKMAESWNGKPVTLGHPKKDGKQCSAQDAAIIEAVGLGVIRNSRVDGMKLLMDAMIETARAKKIHPDLYARLSDGGTEEVSVGAMVVTDKVPGVAASGKRFVGHWNGGEGDHLAFLPGGRGACSVAMGCGTHRAAMRVCGNILEDEVESIIDPATLKCLRDIPQSTRDTMKASDFAGPNESFPISTQADVDAAAHLVGKAADPAAVKAKIISIAKRKGLTLPKAWQTMKAAQAGDDAEEQAELIAYQSMRTILDGVKGQFDEISALVNALIADETESPTETPEEEDAEETIETARLDAIRGLCQSLASAIGAVGNATYCQSLSDSPRYMEGRELAGARHSAKDAGLIQDMHDGAMALGAQCDRGNTRTAEQKNNVTSIDDPIQRYIASVRKSGAR